MLSISYGLPACAIGMPSILYRCASNVITTRYHSHVGYQYVMTFRHLLSTCHRYYISVLSINELLLRSDPRHVLSSCYPYSSHMLPISECALYVINVSMRYRDPINLLLQAASVLSTCYRIMGRPSVCLHGNLS